MFAGSGHGGGIWAAHLLTRVWLCAPGLPATSVAGTGGAAGFVVGGCLGLPGPGRGGGVVIAAGVV